MPIDVSVGACLAAWGPHQTRVKVVALGDGGVLPEIREGARTVGRILSSCGEEKRDAHGSGGDGASVADGRLLLP